MGRQTFLMRLLILEKEQARLMRDRSPYGTPRWVVEEKIDGYLGVKHDRLVGLLVEAVKEQQEQIDELKDEVKKLKGDN